MRHFIVLCTLWIACLGTAYAQIPDTSAAGRLGRHLFGSYFGSDIDTVDLYNGNLMLNITLFSRAGRDLSESLQLSYNARGWQPNYNNTIGYYQGGWRIRDSVGFAGIAKTLVNCIDDVGGWTIAGYWRDNFGVHHTYAGDPVSGSCDGGSPPAGSFNLYPDDGDSSLLTEDSSGNIILYFKDGTVLDVTGTPKLKTRNGNFLEKSYSNGGFAVQDTLGRSVSFSTDRGSSTTPLCDYTPTSPVPYSSTTAVRL